jgi:hypothetical protein
LTSVQKEEEEREMKLGFGGEMGQRVGLLRFERKKRFWKVLQADVKQVDF